MWFSQKVQDRRRGREIIDSCLSGGHRGHSGGMPPWLRARATGRGGVGAGRARAGTGRGEPRGLAGARPGLFGRQGALRTHAPRCLPPGAVRGGSIGAAAEERLAPF